MIIGFGTDASSIMNFVNHPRLTKNSPNIYKVAYQTSFVSIDDEPECTVKKVFESFDHEDNMPYIEHDEETTVVSLIDLYELNIMSVSSIIDSEIL